MLAIRHRAPLASTLGIMEKENIARVALWIFVAGVAIWAVSYFLVHLNSSSFQEGAMGNLFATILGVMVGIPIALEISRRQQAAHHVTTLAISSNEANQRKVRVLSLLRSELESNKTDVLARAKDVASGGKRQVSVNTLRDELWSAFSDGGELHYVNNPELLASIAAAYHEIRSTIHLERRYMEAIHYPGMMIQQSKYPQDYFLEYLTRTDPSVLAAIESAVIKIDLEVPARKAGVDA